MQLTFFDKVVCEAESPVLEKASQLLWDYSDSGTLLAAFYDELQVELPIWVYSQTLDIETRLTPAFSAECIFKKHFGVSYKPRTTSIELAPYDFNSKVVGQSIKLRRILIYVDDNKEIAVVAAMENSGVQHCLRRYSLFLLGHLSASDIKQYDAAVRREHH